MTGPFRIVGMIALCCYLTGCSTYCEVPWSTGDPGTESGEATEDCAVKTGDRVRLTVVGGGKFEGKLASMDQAGVAIQLGWVAEEVEEPRFFSRDEIATLEKVGTDGLATGVIAVVFAGLVVGGIYLSSVDISFGQ